MHSGGFSFGILGRTERVLVVFVAMFQSCRRNHHSNKLRIFTQEINYEIFYWFASYLVVFRYCLG